jgi:hypothetical protein
LISATSVDDLLLVSNSKTESDLAASQIQQKFAITDGGDTQWLLGYHICQWRDKRLLAIDQEQYTTQILADFDMQHCNAIKTPCPITQLTSAMCPTTDDECCEAGLLPYCAIIGKCMYLSNCMWPNISFTVHKLAKYMLNYGPKHFEATKHLLWYLQGTQSRGITVPMATHQTHTQSSHLSLTPTGPCPKAANQSQDSSLNAGMHHSPGVTATTGGDYAVSCMADFLSACGAAYVVTGTGAALVRLSRIQVLTESVIGFRVIRHAWHAATKDIAKVSLP